jgi:hypothetical protein
LKQIHWSPFTMGYLNLQIKLNKILFDNFIKERAQLKF